MENFGTIRPPPPPPPARPPPRVRPIPWLTWHDVKNGKSHLKRPQNQNQQFERVNKDYKLPSSPKITKLHQDPNLENHEHTPSQYQYRTTELTEGSGSGTTRHDWVITIREKLEQAEKIDHITSWGKHCIYKVPQYLHKSDKKSYYPQTVSLGPYHHGEDQTLSMESHKLRAVNMVLKRMNQGIEVFIDAMVELEEKARACYEGPIGFDSNEFTEMLVVDGCFVLELFKGSVEGFSEIGYDHNDPVFAVRGLMHSIQRDMIMLENQLPLFVLKRLLDLQLGTHNQIGLEELVVRFFIPLMPTAKTLAEYSLPRGESSGGLHCLDIFHRSLLSPRSSGKAKCSRVADKHLQRVIPTVSGTKGSRFSVQAK